MELAKDGTSERALEVEAKKGVTSACHSGPALPSFLSPIPRPWKRRRLIPHLYRRHNSTYNSHSVKAMREANTLSSGRRRTARKVTHDYTLAVLGNNICCGSYKLPCIYRRRTNARTGWAERVCEWLRNEQGYDTSGVTRLSEKGETAASAAGMSANHAGKRRKRVGRLVLFR
jgi:hypothetical protein